MTVPFNWSKIQAVALHAAMIFATVTATNLAALSSAHSYSADKAIVVSAISAAFSSVLVYLHTSLTNTAVANATATASPASPPAPPAA